MARVASDRSRRTTKPPQQFYPMIDGANDKTRLGKAMLTKWYKPVATDNDATTLDCS